MGFLINPYLFALPITLSFVGDTTSSLSTVSLHGSAVAGDICVLLDFGYNSSGTAVNSAIPSGFTAIWDGTTSISTYRIRNAGSVKILSAGDITAGSLTGINTTNNRKICGIFRPSVAISAVGVAGGSQIASHTAPSRTLSNAGVSGPAIALCQWGESTGATVSPRTASPAMTEFNSPAVNFWGAYKMYGTVDAPESYTNSMQDEGSGNAMGIGYVTITP